MCVCANLVTVAVLQYQMLLLILQINVIFVFLDKKRTEHFCLEILFCGGVFKFFISC